MIMTETGTYEEILGGLSQAGIALAGTDPCAARAVNNAAALLTRQKEEIAALEQQLRDVEERKTWRKERQAEGIAAAHERGVTFGRPRVPLPDNFEEVRQAWYYREISSREATHRLGVSQDTFLRWCKKKQ